MIKEKKFKEIAEVYQNFSQKISWQKEPANLYDPFQYVMQQQGKKLRPLSLLVSYSLFQSDLTQALPAAYGIELFHNFTLIHDDIMDQAETRRGLQSVHKKFGESMGILSGDTMLMESCKYVLKSCPSIDILEEFMQTAIQVCEGQAMDMQFESRQNISLIEYIQMIQLKTSILLAQSLKMGAQIAQQSSAIQEQLYQLGIQLGNAFQIQDDYLDLYANEQEFGKQKGGDLLRRKMSILILLAIDDLSPEERNKQIIHYHTRRSQNEQIEYYLNYFKEKEVDKKYKLLYREYLLKCENTLKNMQIAEESKLTLNYLSEIILNRTK